MFSFLCSLFCNGKHSVFCSAHDSLKYHRVAFKYLPKSLLMFNVNNSSIFAFVTFSTAQIYSIQCESITFHLTLLTWCGFTTNRSVHIQSIFELTQLGFLFFVKKKKHTNSIKQQHTTVKWPFFFLTFEIRICLDLI